MIDRDFVLNTFLDKMVKTARVNLCTGEYAFVKMLQTQAEEESMAADTIDGYFQNLIDRGQIYPDDVASYRYHMDLGFLRERVFAKKDKVANSFRYKMDDEYIWVTLEVVTPEDISEENPWVVYCWRESDEDACIMEDGMKKISGIYDRVLKINLTTDSYMELAKDGSERKSSKPPRPAKISKLFRKLARSGGIHRGDVKEFLAFTDIEILKENFQEDSGSIHLRYRQKVGEVFHWFSMEFMPSVEYTEENQVIMLYIKDVHDEYIIETNHHRKLAYYANFDTMTGVWNHEYFYKRCKEYSESADKYPAAIMDTNINGMRERNKAQGLAEGDRYIRSFAELLAGEFGKNSCYRMNGDEFLVLLERENERAVKSQFKIFQDVLKKQKVPMAAVGFVWSGAPATFEELLNEAENNMFIDKQNYYRKANVGGQKTYKVHTDI